ncbi:hypothetical protein F5X68DRAFT_10984 [Plectosphaerella plurivora]|uniref:Uncharacterized protein n=1 Tax=Plectosphaerella plurivora TaxID=936078 RepID=A0A9P8VCE9_9PEZI|nr:hypothetical protein F5X68DRAFT_10984 [Plectosphaerella plurivora]
MVPHHSHGCTPSEATIGRSCSRPPHRPPLPWTVTPWTGQIREVNQGHRQTSHQEPIANAAPESQLTPAARVTADSAKQKPFESTPSCNFCTFPPALLFFRWSTACANTRPPVHHPRFVGTLEGNGSSDPACSTGVSRILTAAASCSLVVLLPNKTRSPPLSAQPLSLLLIFLPNPIHSYPTPAPRGPKHCFYPQHPFSPLFLPTVPHSHTTRDPSLSRTTSSLPPPGSSCCATHSAPDLLDLHPACLVFNQETRPSREERRAIQPKDCL